jgi:putative Mg2+ transporter-C (MgtC) family protein
MSWDQFIIFINNPEITVGSAIFKLSLSLLAGGFIGLNRERQNQPAGFRTHILICVGATLLMMLSIYIPQTYLGFKNGDPGRIAAQVVSGIGFLGAGAIIRLGTNVRGITTAASIWLISAVGLAIGAGLYIISFVVVAIALFTLVVLERIEHWYFPQTMLKTFTLTFDDANYPGEAIKAIFTKAKISISDYSVDIQNKDNKLTSVSIVVKIPETINLSKVISDITALSKAISIKIN